jgi:hypothetical protein
MIKEKLIKSEVQFLHVYFIPHNLILAIKKVEINDKAKKEDKKEVGGKKGPAKK